MKALIVSAVALGARIILIMRKNTKEKRRRKEVYSHGERDTSSDAVVVKTNASVEQVQRTR